MIVEIKVPTPGESITEVEISSWLVNDGDIVERDQDLAEIESDKATLSLVATDSGRIKIKASAGELINVGAIACTIDTSFKPEEKATTDAPVEKEAKEEPQTAPVKKVEESVPEKDSHVKISPLAKELMKEHSLSVDDVINGLRRISSSDVKAVLGHASSKENAAKIKAVTERVQERNRMSQLRKKISQRLVAVKNETAMLTTFNEVDMSAIMALRKKYQQAFIDKHGVKLGFMSFFLKASALAIKHHPMVNSMVDGDEIVSHNYVDISVAVQTPKGLMVPVIRNVQSLTLAEIEQQLGYLAEKARKGTISLEEMTGGTFTVTNGGVFGSMLSTPIINPPQSAILGMHNIVERPVAVNGKVEIKPVMYVALSYDHRIVDGKDSVGMLVKVKEMLENPAMFLTDGLSAEKAVLDL